MGNTLLRFHSHCDFAGTHIYALYVRARHLAIFCCGCHNLQRNSGSGQYCQIGLSGQRLRCSTRRARQLCRRRCICLNQSSQVR